MLTDREIQVLKRRMRGESQQAIAKSLGVSQAAISKFEKNAHHKILDAEQLLIVAKELGVTTKKTITGRKVTYKERAE